MSFPLKLQLMSRLDPRGYNTRRVAPARHTLGPPCIPTPSLILKAKTRARNKSVLQHRRVVAGQACPGLALFVVPPPSINPSQPPTPTSSDKGNVHLKHGSRYELSLRSFMSAFLSLKLQRTAGEQKLKIPNRQRRARCSKRMYCTHQSTIGVDMLRASVL